MGNGAEVHDLNVHIVGAAGTEGLWSSKGSCPQHSGRRATSRGFVPTVSCVLEAIGPTKPLERSSPASRAPSVLNNGMSILGLGIERQQAVKGLVLLFAVAFDVYNKRRAGGRGAPLVGVASGRFRLLPGLAGRARPVLCANDGPGVEFRSR